MKKISNDKHFSEAKKDFGLMKGDAGTRNELYDEIKNAFLLEWPDKPNEEGLKLTISPAARNAVLGVARLLSGTAPIISVESKDKGKADNAAENFLQSAWAESSKTAGVKLHFDAALSAVLYSKVHLTVMLTSELLKTVSKQTSKAHKRRIEKLAESTPVLFKVLNPGNGYERRDSLGLCKYAREEATTLGEVRRLYGQGADHLQGDDADAVDLFDSWDLDYHFAWVDGNDTPLVAVEHELPAIPVAIAMADGTRLFDDEDEQIQPFLYTLIKSGLWYRQNLALTVASTNLFQFGLTPPIWYKRQSDNHLKADFSGPIPVIELNANEEIGALGLPAVSPELWKYKQEIDQMAEASTIYSQTLGQSLGSNSTFSATALLSRSGQLPLQGPREAVGSASAELFDIALDWLAEEGSDHELVKKLDLKSDREIVVKLDVKMPMDFARNLELVNSVSASQNPTVSDDWLLENVLQITDPDEMRRKVTAQIAYKARTMIRMQTMLKQMEAMSQQPPPPQGQPTPQGQPGGMPTHTMPDGTQMPGATHEEAMAAQQMPAATPMGAPGPDGTMSEPMAPRGEMISREVPRGRQ